jgi:FAD/FMN-containing dehydrogenase
MRALPAIPDVTIIEDPDRLEPYRRDEGHVVGPLPIAVVKPHSPAALRELVRLARIEGFGLVPRGAGTGKAGGCVTRERSVVVDMSEWPGEIKVSRPDMTLTAPSSAMLRDVKGAAEALGLFYPPDPNSWDQCAFGGTLANAGGPCACKYGMTRHWVLALDALMADGEIHTFGITSVKNNAGPNLAQLLVGSEGIFGLITQATVRLIPQPRTRLTLLLPVKAWQDLLDLPSTLVTAGMLPSAFEFWDPAVLEDLRRFGSGEASRLPGEALALLEFDDPDCGTEEFLARLMEVLGPVSDDLQVATDVRQREALWAVRRMTSVHLKDRYPQKVSEDIVVPRSRVRDFFDGVEALKIPLVTYGHLGDGNLHVNLLTAGEMSREVLDRALMELFSLCLRLGGTLSGEHGIGLAKRDAFLSLADPYIIETLRGIKKAVDPQNVFNPGKVI